VIGADDASGRGAGSGGGFKLDAFGRGEGGAAENAGERDHHGDKPFDKP
jgi:hypothetical protein